MAYVADSPIHGDGVFASRDMANGESIEVYYDLVPEPEAVAVCSNLFGEFFLATPLILSLMRLNAAARSRVLESYKGRVHDLPSELVTEVASIWAPRKHVISEAQITELTQMVVCYNIAVPYPVPAKDASGAAGTLHINVGCIGALVSRINHPAAGQAANVRPASMIGSAPILKNGTYTIACTLRMIAPVRQGDELVFDYQAAQATLI
jgi:hypothetical protein